MNARTSRAGCLRELPGVLVAHRRSAAVRLVSREGGFTLIEIMIVVTIVAILSAIAYPNYKENVARGKRAAAQAVLVEAAQLLERCYSEQNNSYTSCTIPTALSQAPRQGDGVAAYTVAATIPTGGQSFTITATRTGAMASDKCGNFTINNIGQKSIASQNSGVASGDCWGH